MTGVYIFLADGFEETEALAPYDVLVRAGIPVKTVSINSDNVVTSSHGVPVIAMMRLDELKEEAFSTTGEKDVMIFPGGMPGSSNLAADEKLMALMNRHYSQGGTVAAICAAPALVLASKMDKGMLEGKVMTCYEGMDAPFSQAGVRHSSEGVVRDGRVISAKGAGFAVAFGLEIAAHLRGRELADKVAASIML